MKQRAKSSPNSRACLAQEFWLRFAAVAVVFGMMRTDIVAVEFDARLAELLVKVRVDLFDCFTGKVAYAADGVCLV
ncbi:MAG: hypothetical protein ABSA97_13385 [Verrucomicrobiia bacterium]